MTPREAAYEIGCTPGTVRTLIRIGELKAKQYKIPGGFVYEITEQEVRRIMCHPNRVGWPRGKKRKRKRKGSRNGKA